MSNPKFKLRKFTYSYHEDESGLFPDWWINYDRKTILAHNIICGVNTKTSGMTVTGKCVAITISSDKKTGKTIAVIS